MNSPRARRGATAFFTAVLFLTVVCASAQTGWRTDWTGRYPTASPPLNWSSTGPMVWKQPLKNWSNATPVLHGGRILLCEEPSTLLCLDQDSGQELWRDEMPLEAIQSADAARSAKEAEERSQVLQQQIRELTAEEREIAVSLRQAPKDQALRQSLNQLRQDRGALQREFQTLRQRSDPKPATHAVNGYTSPTPVARGKRVWSLFGTGVAAAHTLEGERLWARVVGRPSHSWGHSASPVWVEGRVIVHVGNTVMALDPDSGDTLWEAQSSSSWGSPLAIRVGDTPAVLTTGGDLIRALDGRHLAKGVGKMPWTSPIEEGGVVYVADQNGAGAYRLSLGDEEAVAVETLWQARPRSDRYYASPVLYQGLLYAVTQRGHLSVIDAATGALAYDKQLSLKGTTYPSICEAGGRIFVSSDTGQTLVLEPGREYKELAANTLEPFRSSPVFVGSRIYVRTLKHLFCLGN